MTESAIWSVDRIAAAELAADLGLPADEALISGIAERLARHRQDAHDWAAERVHANLMRRLDVAAVRLFERSSDAYANGFRAAEHEIIAVQPRELLELGPERVRSTGQVLRALMKTRRTEV